MSYNSEEEKHLLKIANLVGNKINFSNKDIVYSLLRLPTNLVEKYFKTLLVTDKKKCFDDLEKFYKKSLQTRRQFIDICLKPIAKISKQDFLKIIEEFEEHLFNIIVPFNLIGVLYSNKSDSKTSFECKKIAFGKNATEAFNQLKIHMNNLNFDLEFKDFKIIELEYQSSMLDKKDLKM